MSTTPRILRDSRLRFYVTEFVEHWTPDSLMDDGAPARVTERPTVILPIFPTVMMVMRRYNEDQFEVRSNKQELWFRELSVAKALDQPPTRAFELRVLRIRGAAREIRALLYVLKTYDPTELFAMARPLRDTARNRRRE